MRGNTCSKNKKGISGGDITTGIEQRAVGISFPSLVADADSVESGTTNIYSFTGSRVLKVQFIINKLQPLYAEL